MANQTSVDITISARENFTKLLVAGNVLANKDVPYTVSGVKPTNQTEAGNFYNTEGTVTVPSLNEIYTLKWRRFTPTDLKLHTPELTREAVAKALEGEGFILSEFSIIYDLQNNQVHMNPHVDSLLYVGSFTMIVFLLTTDNAVESINQKQIKEIVEDPTINVMQLYIEGKGEEYTPPPAGSVPDTGTEEDWLNAYLEGRGEMDVDSITV